MPEDSDPLRFAAVDLLAPWDGREPGTRLELVPWLAVHLMLRGIARPAEPEVWQPEESA